MSGPAHVQTLLHEKKLVIPFLDFVTILVADFEFFTDAVGNPELGVGLYLAGDLAFGQWPEGFVPQI